VPLLVALALLSVRGTRVGPDSAWYLALALNLYHGLGYVGVEGVLPPFRGPLFPGLIALSYATFGTSAWSALLVVRAFYVATICLVYALGARLFSGVVGLTASLLLLTSVTYYQWSSQILTDSVVLFFLLLTLWLTYEGFATGRLGTLGWAGMVLGLGYLTKEVAIFLAPLPLLLWLSTRSVRTTRGLVGVALFLAAFLLTVAPWLLYFKLATRELAPLQPGRMPTKASQGAVTRLAQLVPTGATSLPSAVVATARNVTASLVDFYRLQFEPQSILAPAFLAAWIFVALRAALFPELADRLLLGGLILFLPLVVLAGATGIPARHTLYLSLTSMIALSHLIWAAVPPTGARRPLLLISTAASVLAIATEVAIGSTPFSTLLTGADRSGYVAAFHTYAPSLGRRDWHTVGWLNPTSEAAGRWLAENVPPGEPIAVDWFWKSAIYFAMDGSRPLIALATGRPSERGGRSRPLFLWLDTHARLNPRRGPIAACSERRLLEEIRKYKIRWAVVTPRTNFLVLYLRANPGFREVKTFGGGKIQIFHVADEVGPIPFPLHVDPKLVGFLRSLAHDDPRRYAELLAVAEKRLGLARSRIESIVDGQESFAPIELNKVY
jgi:4-amino-4-deoxy-L-arabinose transferase-like glycosyltransferase